MLDTAILAPGTAPIGSLWHATVHKVPIRFLLLLASSLCLSTLADLALLKTL